MTTADEEVLRVAQSRLGQVFKGKYCLDRVLGVGGMGSVYAATHRNRMRFAIKVLHPDLSNIESIRARFLREGYVANSVNHPGAVAVLDDDISEDGSAFLVMELLEGRSFEALWEASGRSLPLTTLLSWLDQVLDVLIAAHEQGIVHRDLKPANLFLTESGLVKVLDFGIARLRDAPGGGLTQTGAALGTPAFMAPEQALGQTDEVDARTDLWALGATLFVLITGRLVHEGDTPQRLLINSATCLAPALRSIAPAVPPGIAAVVDRALAFSREQRFASAREMKDALARSYREAFGTNLPTTSEAALPDLPRTELGSIEHSFASRASRASRPAVHFAQTRPLLRVETNGSPVVHIASVASAAVPRRPFVQPLIAAALLAAVIGTAVGITLHYARQSSVAPPIGSLPSERASAASPPGPASIAASNGHAEAAPQSTLLRAIPSVTATASSAQRTAAPGAPNAIKPTSEPSALCARLLERQSLGETLSPAEHMIFSRNCRK